MIAIQFFNGKSQFSSQEAEKLFHYSKKLQTLINVLFLLNNIIYILLLFHL